MGKTGARETITRKACPGVLMRQLEPLRFLLSEQDRALKTPTQAPHFIEEVTGLEGESDLPRVMVAIKAAPSPAAHSPPTQISGQPDTLLCRNQSHPVQGHM